MDVPGIDVVISGHAPVVQAGKESRNLGTQVITLDGDKLTAEPYRRHPVDDTIAGDRAVAAAIEVLEFYLGPARLEVKNCNSRCELGEESWQSSNSTT